MGKFGVTPGNGVSNISRQTKLCYKRFQSSRLQLQEQVKDSHVSEIIDVYEQKLVAYAVSTSGLRTAMNTAVTLQTSNHAV